MNTQTTLSQADFTKVKQAARHSNIGQLLLQQGKLTASQAEKVLLAQQELGLRFGEAAVRLGFLSEQDIQEVLSRQFDYPCLTVGDPSLDSRLIAAYHNDSSQVEALRSLRSQLILRWVSGGNKTICVAGYENETAVGWLAANLAIVFSQLGERTLLIDANLRSPQQHQLFRLENRAGLADVLASRARLDCAQRIGHLLGLSVLTAGTPATAQLTIERVSLLSLLVPALRRWLDPPAYECTAPSCRRVVCLGRCRRTRPRGGGCRGLEESRAGGGGRANGGGALGLWGAGAGGV